MDNQKQPYQGWAIVELFGHNQIAGHLSEQEIGGTTFIRVDVPPTEGDGRGFTKFIGPSAVFAIVPTTEDIAREAARRLSSRPVLPWLVPVARQLPQTVDSPVEYRTASASETYFATENEPEF